MTRIPPPLLIVTAISIPALLGGCQKKEPPPVVDAGPPPAVSMVPTVTELAPLTDDAGDDSGASDAGAKRWVGPAVNPNQQKIQACCNAMRAQAKAMGSSPEATQLLGAAATCDTFVKQVGPAGSAPELAAIRSMLKSVKLPVACQ
ncbi:MAG: hypothetical protein ABTD50_11810 [Polyangiaceae bacterium]|jgi:hypothetical protein